MVAAMLNGGEAGKVATGLLENAESALALMGTACEAIKKRRWDEAEGTLKKLQTFVNQLRVEIGDQDFRIQQARRNDGMTDGGRRIENCGC